MQPHTVKTILPLLLSPHQIFVEIIKLSSESTSVLISPPLTIQMSFFCIVGVSPSIEHQTIFSAFLHNPLDVKKQVERQVIDIINNLAVSPSKRFWYVQMTHTLIPFYLLHISLIVRFAPIRGIYLLKQGQTAHFLRLFTKMVPFELHI
jgi:hypothetical protein